MDSGNESYHDLISTEMSEDIRDGSQSHMNVNQRESRYKIRDCIRQRPSEWKGAIKDMLNKSKGLHKVFKTLVKDIFGIYHLWENLVQKFPISFQNLKTLLKLENCQITLINLG